MRASDAGLLLAVPLWLWWAGDDGGYPVAVWGGGFAYLAVAAVLLATSVPRPPLSGLRLAALLALAAHTAFAALSLLWADDRSLAWTGAGRAALLTGALALPLLWPPGRAGLRAGVLCFVGAALVGVIAGFVAAFGGGEALGDGRLTSPTGYPNATAALFVMGALAALGLAVERRAAPLPRAALAGTAALLGGAALLAQSRGSLAALLVALALALLVAPRRAVFAAAALGVAAAVAATAPLLVDVRTAALAGDADPELTTAALVLLALFAVVAVLAVLAIRLAPRVPVPAGALAAVRRWGPRVAVAAAALAVAGVAVAGEPADWIRDRVDDVSTPRYDELEESDTRFTGNLGSNRVDYWKVAVALTAERPAGGTGAGGFAAAYLLDRESEKSPLYAHSTWLQAGADLGLPGLLTLLAFAVALAGALRSALRAGPEDRELRVAAWLPLLYLAVHGSVDWLTVFPALAVPAVALAAGATARWPGAEATGSRGRSIAVAVVLVLAALAVVPLAFAARYQERAAEQAAASPRQALDDLDRAQALNPVNPGSAAQEGLVRLRLRDPSAVAAFSDAIERDPNAWFPLLMRGLVAAQAGDRASALADLRRAARLNPREPAVEEALRAVSLRRSVDPLTAAGMLLARRG